MASDVDICNLALSRLGDSATVASIDPPEGSAQAEYCARFYPIARDSLLESHSWKFATRRIALAQLVHDTWNWSFAYAAPAGAIRLLAVLAPSASNDCASVEFEAESDPAGVSVIYTNLEDATMRYIARVTDTTKFSPLFVDALGWLLASHLAGPMIKGDSGIAVARSCYQTFRTVHSQAVESDANQRKVVPSHTPEWMVGRGPVPGTGHSWGR